MSRHQQSDPTKSGATRYWWWGLGIFLFATVILLGVGLTILYTYLGKRHAAEEDRRLGEVLQEATRAEEEGRLEETVELLGTYLVSNPQDTDALEKYGVALEKLATTPKAKGYAYQVLEQVIRRDPERRAARRRVAELGIQLEKYDDAARHLEILQRSDPNNAEVSYLIGLCSERQGDHDKAAKMYAKAIEISPDRIDPYVRLARLLQNRRELEQAGLVLDRLVATHELSYQAYLARAAHRKQFHSFAEADKDVQQALKLSPRDPEALWLAAEIARADNRLDEARGYLRRGMAVRPREIRLYRELASLEHQAGRRDHAVAAVRKGLEAEPDHSELLVHLAELLIEGSELKEATQVVDRLRGLDNISPEWVSYLEGYLFLKKGQWSEATRRLGRVNAPGLQIRALPLLATCYQQQGALDLQLDALRQALQMAAGSPHEHDIRLAHADALAALGRIEEALQGYRRLLAHFPTKPVIVKKMVPLLVSYNLRLPSSHRRWEEVDQLLEAAARTADAVEVRIWKAEVTAAKGQQDQATEQLTQLHKEHPDRLDVWLALSGSLARQGESEKALQILEEGERRFGRRVELSLARVAYWSRRPGEEAGRSLVKLEADLEHLKSEDQTTLLRGLAAAHHARSDLKEAQRLQVRLAELLPDDPSLRVSLIELALSTGDEAMIGKALGEIEKLTGEGGTLWAYGRACQLIAAATKQGDKQGLNEARALLARVSDLRPGWAAVRLREANILELQEQPVQAIEHYLRAIELGEHSPEVVRRAYRLLIKNERRTEAEQLLERLQKAGALPEDLRQELKKS